MKSTVQYIHVIAFRFAIGHVHNKKICIQYMYAYTIEMYTHAYRYLYLTCLSSKVDKGVGVHHPSIESEDVLPSLALHLNSIEVLRPTNHIEVPACSNTIIILLYRESLLMHQ